MKLLLKTILILTLCGIVYAEQQREESRAVPRSGITIQQPVTATFSVSTTVACPDDGMVLLSSIKRISEEQVEAAQAQNLRNLERERQILRQLEMPVTLNAEKPLTLEQAVLMICAQVDLVPQIDYPALREADVRTDTMTTLPWAHGIKPKNVLNLILEQHGLVYVVNHGMLNITTAKNAQGAKFGRFYYIGDIAGRNGLDNERITDIITSVIEPDSW